MLHANLLTSWKLVGTQGMVIATIMIIAGRRKPFLGVTVLIDLPNHHSFKGYLSVLLISNALVMDRLFTDTCIIFFSPENNPVIILV